MRQLWKRIVEDVAEVWRVSPNLLRFLVGIVPRRVWSVMHPSNGWGPDCETPHQAMEFIEAERESADDPVLTEEEREEYRNAPSFTEAELRRLWYPGARIERNGWAIKCFLAPRGLYSLHEWNGW